jgi:hypothetical protein
MKRPAANPANAPGKNGDRFVLSVDARTLRPEEKSTMSQRKPLVGQSAPAAAHSEEGEKTVPAAGYSFAAAFQRLKALGFLHPATPEPASAAARPEEELNDWQFARYASESARWFEDEP